MTLLTLREVAAALKVSATTARRWVRDGSLAAYKVGKRGQLRVRDEDLESFLEKHRIGSIAGSTLQEGNDDPPK